MARMNSLGKEPRRPRSAWLLVLVGLAVSCGPQSSSSNPTPPSTTTPTASASASPAPTATTSSTTSTATPGSRCHTAELALTLRELSPAAGNRYAALVLTDQAGRGCTLYGYPGLQQLDGAFQPMPTDLVRNASPAPQIVHLSPGQSAFSLLHWGAVPAPDEARPGAPCEPVAAYAKVTPPDETTQLLASWNMGEVCFHGRIFVDALVPGTGRTF